MPSILSFGDGVKKFQSKIMDKVFDEACNSQIVCEVRICAALVYKRSIVVARQNVLKTHPFQKRYSRFSGKKDYNYLHAETHCIIAALKAGFEIDRLSSCDLYVARAIYPSKSHWPINGNQFWRADARPCVGCMSCIDDFAIRHVFFTTNKQTVECV